MDTRITNPVIRTAARLGWLAVALLAFGLVSAGIGPYARLLGQVCSGPEADCVEQSLLLPSEAASLADSGLTMASYAAIMLATDLVFKFLWVTTGIVLFLSRSDDWMALLVSLFLVTFSLATFSQSIVNQAALAYPILEAPARFLIFAGDALIISFFLLFPGGQFVPRWAVWPGLVLVSVSAFTYILPGTPLDLDRWPAFLSTAYFVVQLALLMVLQVYRYRRVSSAVQRYQTRWAVTGMIGALSGLLLVAFIFQLSDLWNRPAIRLFGDALIALSMSLIPLSLRVAVTRYRLWDIDLIIRRTLLYSAMTVILAGLYFGLVLLFQRVVLSLFGTESQAAIVLSTLVVVILVQPLRRRLQDWIDRRFYRRKYDAQRMLAEFTSRARKEVNPTQIGSDMLAVVEEALQPEHTMLWLKTQERPE